MHKSPRTRSSPRCCHAISPAAAASKMNACRICERATASSTIQRVTGQNTAPVATTSIHAIRRSARASSGEGAGEAAAGVAICGSGSVTVVTALPDSAAAHKFPTACALVAAGGSSPVRDRRNLPFTRASPPGHTAATILP